MQSALAQTTHTVTLGITGIRPDPAITTAQQDDIVNFIFGAGVHSVTQSSLEAPCTPLPGGFNSGLVSIADNSGENRTWALRVTNPSQPIWFYCQALRPTPHCPDGMVGAINAPADMYATFVSAASSYTGTQDPAPSVVLSGIGALATNSPSAPSGSASQSLASSSSPASSTTPTSTAPATSPTSTARGGTSPNVKLGGPVGGITTLVTILTLGVLLSH